MQLSNVGSIYELNNNFMNTTMQASWTNSKVARVKMGEKLLGWPTKHEKNNNLTSSASMNNFSVLKCYRDRIKSILFVALLGLYGE